MESSSNQERKKKLCFFFSMSPACHPTNAHRCWRPRPDADARVHFMRLNLLHPPLPAAAVPILITFLFQFHHRRRIRARPSSTPRHGDRNGGPALAAIFLPLSARDKLKPTDETTAAATQTACQKSMEKWRSAPARRSPPPPLAL